MYDFKEIFGDGVLSVSEFEEKCREKGVEPDDGAELRRGWRKFRIENAVKSESARLGAKNAGLVAAAVRTDDIDDDEPEKTVRARIEALRRSDPYLFGEMPGIVSHSSSDENSMTDEEFYRTRFN